MGPNKARRNELMPTHQQHFTISISPIMTKTIFTYNRPNGLLNVFDRNKRTDLGA